MVLAEFVEFKHGLYKSCGIECFEVIVLETCLLQPCFHVAGHALRRRRRQEASHSSQPLFLLCQFVLAYVWLHLVYVIVIVLSSVFSVFSHSSQPLKPAMPALAKTAACCRSPATPSAAESRYTLRYATLRYATLSYRALRCAALRYAALRCAKLRCATLR